MWRLISLFTAVLLLGGCLGLGGSGNSPAPSATPTITIEPSVEPSPSPSEAPASTAVPAATAEEAANAIIGALHQQDMEKLSSYIHPEKGLLFSPYGHIDKDTAITFQAGELPALKDQEIYKWGSFDGSGEPISLTFGNYYQKFVYDRNFAEAEEVGHNKVLGQGNSLVNIQEIYPDCTYFDYHFSGFDPELSGMDWESLILVLEQHSGAWYLCAIVHAQWTI